MFSSRNQIKNQLTQPNFAKNFKILEMVSISRQQEITKILNYQIGYKRQKKQQVSGKENIYILRFNEEKKQMEVIIVDYQNTGRLNVGSRWSGGLHQFVEVKHKIKPQDQNLTAASMSHPAFFHEYLTIYGLTGTIGTQQQRIEVQKVYEVDSFDVPPHYPSLRKRLPLTICKEEEYSNKILDKIATHHKNRRPVLVLMKTIQQTEQFSKFLHEKQIKHLLLNEMQKEDEDYIVSKAGLPYSIVVATNAAGRGTDIILSPDAKKDGGLHVIFAFYPANSRVEDQGLGRAGRQGQKGSCEVIVHELDEQFCKYKHFIMLFDQRAEEKLTKLREQKIQVLSLRRQDQSLVQTIKYRILKAFCIELSNIRSKLFFQNFHNYLSICSNFQYQQKEIMLEINDNNPLIQQIIRKGMTLLNLQLQGFKVDWIPFVKSIIEQDQINLIQQKWGIFYSNILSNKYQFLDPSSYEAVVIELFEQFKKQVLLPYKLDLSGKITFTINSVLSQSYFDLKSQHYE